MASQPVKRTECVDAHSCKHPACAPQTLKRRDRLCQHECNDARSSCKGQWIGQCKVHFSFKIKSTRPAVRYRVIRETISEGAAEIAASSIHSRSRQCASGPKCIMQVPKSLKLPQYNKTLIVATAQNVLQNTKTDMLCSQNGKLHPKLHPASKSIAEPDGAVLGPIMLSTSDCQDHCTCMMDATTLACTCNLTCSSRAHALIRELTTQVCFAGSFLQHEQGYRLS